MSGSPLVASMSLSLVRRAIHPIYYEKVCFFLLQTWLAYGVQVFRTVDMWSMLHTCAGNSYISWTEILSSDMILCRERHLVHPLDNAFILAHSPGQMNRPPCAVYIFSTSDGTLGIHICAFTSFCLAADPDAGRQTGLRSRPAARQQTRGPSAITMASIIEMLILHEFGLLHQLLLKQRGLSRLDHV